MSSIVNFFTSVDNLYPVGASISSIVYVPSSRSVNTYGSLPVVNLAISLPLEFFTTRTAPGNTWPVDASIFVILTTLVLGVFSYFIVGWIYNAALSAMQNTEVN